MLELDAISKHAIELEMYDSPIELEMYDSPIELYVPEGYTQSVSGLIFSDGSTFVTDKGDNIIAA